MTDRIKAVSFLSMRQKTGAGVSASSEVARSSPAASLDFMGPLQVVRPGLLSRHALDEILQVPPETQLLQRVVQPTWTGEPLLIKKDKNTWELRKRGRTCGDAEIRLVGGDVVDAVVLAGEDDVPVL